MTKLLLEMFDEQLGLWVDVRHEKDLRLLASHVQPPMYY